MVLYFRSKYPFEEYISYPNFTFTMKEIKHLWRQNGCESKYGRRLVMRTDDFEKPSHTNVLCSNWKEWEQPIIWYSDTVFLRINYSIYFFLVVVLGLFTNTQKTNKFCYEIICPF